MSDSVTFRLMINHGRARTSRTRLIRVRGADCLARHWVGVVVALMFLPTTRSAQTTATVADAPTCLTCRITAARVSVLQVGPQVPELVSKPYSMARDSKGRVILAFDGAPGNHLLLYGPSGAFIQTVGRGGAGPGEYRAAMYVSFGPGDTAYVFDVRNARVTILSPAMTYIRSAPIPPWIFSTAVTKAGTIAISSGIPDAERVGKAFHTFDRVGNQLKSFGFTDATVISGRGALAISWIAASADGGFWASTQSRDFVVSKWTDDGQMLLRLNRQSSLVPKTDEPKVWFTKSRPPSPYVRSLAEDSDGRIWVEIVAPDPNWQRGVSFDGNARGELATLAQVNDYDKAFDTVIEIIDPVSRSVVARQRFDECFSLLLGQNRIAKSILQDDGSFRVEVYQLHLEGIEGRPRP